MSEKYLKIEITKSNDMHYKFVLVKLNLKTILENIKTKNLYITTTHKNVLRLNIV